MDNQQNHINHIFAIEDYACVAFRMIATLFFTVWKVMLLS